MKFLVFVDLHQDFGELEQVKEKSLGVDFLLCLGDFTIFGMHMEEILEKIDSIGKPVYLIHGNHESRKEVETACASFSNIEFMHKKTLSKDNTLFLFFGGGGFSQREPEFSRFVSKHMKEIASHKNKVLLTHAPPIDTDLDAVTEDWHVGVEDYREFIDQYKPNFAFSGHIHESYKKKQKLGETVLVNPGGDGEVFEID